MSAKHKVKDVYYILKQKNIYVIANYPFAWKDFV